MNTYSVSIHCDAENEEFIATCKEFPYLSGIADSKEEALAVLEEAIDASVEMLIEDKDSVPAPCNMPEYSGNIRLRLPKSLHKQLVEMAELDGISLNQYMVSLLSTNAGKIIIHKHDHQHDHFHLNSADTSGIKTNRTVPLKFNTDVNLQNQLTFESVLEA